MRKHLTALHRPHNRRVDGVASVLVNIRLNLLLVVNLRERNLDPAHPVGELFVVREHVVLVNALVLGFLEQDLVLGARQRVQVTRHVFIWQSEPLANLRVLEGLLLVEEEQDGSLEQVDVELDGLGREVPFHSDLTEAVNPRQLAVLQLLIVKLLKRGDASDALLGQRQLGEFVRGPEPGGQNRDGELHLGLAGLVVV